MLSEVTDRLEYLIAGSYRVHCSGLLSEVTDRLEYSIAGSYRVHCSDLIREVNCPEYCPTVNSKEGLGLFSILLVDEFVSSSL